MKYESVRGTKDILPEIANVWQNLESKFFAVSKLFGYQELRTPIFEKTEVFNRSIGEQTDIVNKEMYTFLDKGGDSITLRPEMTAALIRSVIQNNLLQQSSILRLWYFGPFFRYERPQKGRLRQFHQYGAECIGSPYPESDAEVIILADNLFKAIGINNYKLLLNSLGNDVSRNNYRIALVEYLNKVKDNLSEESQARIERNPLRVLDSKSEKDLPYIVEAPNIIDFLDNESKFHFEKVADILVKLSINYEISPRLVRGLDYYSHTVFEFQSNYLGSQNSFGGGGRYDKLIEQMGGKPTPAIGFALGVERLILILNEIYGEVNKPASIDIMIISSGIEQHEIIFQIAGKLRARGMNVLTDISRRSIKAQLRETNKYFESGNYGTKFVIIIGQNEIENSILQLKNLETGEQFSLTIEELDSLEFK